VAFGFVVAVVLFVVNYSRLSVIKGETTGRTHGGNVDRDLQTRQLLNAEGDRILILTLQGFIFFGTSAKLMQQIRAQIEDTERAHLDFLVLDFHHVSQLDTSAIQAFSKLAQLSERHRFHVVITGADPQSLARLAQIDFLTETGPDCRRISFEQMDDGIAWCEEAILEEHSQRVTRVRREFDDLMMLVTDQDTRSAKVLGAYFTREEHEHGTYLFRQGEPGDSLYLLGSGAVAVAMEVGGVERLIRYYQAGAMIGEMALLTGDPRSASVLVETDATVYRMQADQLHALQAEHPSVAEKLNRYTFRLLSERLVRANRELQQFR
jgi:SulP family sulfate permease